METKTNCPLCHSSHIEIFYELTGVPTNSVLLFRSRENALNCQTGDIMLAYCHHCSFIYNCSFENALLEYSPDCEETQGYSPTFTRFQDRIATKLVEQYDVRHKDIVEIGCGKGEFLSLLCKRGDNHGMGFDPAYAQRKNSFDQPANVSFVNDFYSDKYGNVPADCFVCKMTLEHVFEPVALVTAMRNAIKDAPGSLVFFQVPNVSKILREKAFWDIYYEHCSYFNTDSLTFLLEYCGFQVSHIWSDYDDQYLLLVAHPVEIRSTHTRTPHQAPAVLNKNMKHFAKRVKNNISDSRQRLKSWYDQKRETVIWGGGSKAVAYLTTLGIGKEVQFVVDINPQKSETYLAGTGHRVVTPESLTTRCPNVVIAMNPVYRDEIAHELNSSGCFPELTTVFLDKNLSENVSYQI